MKLPKILFLFILSLFVFISCSNNSIDARNLQEIPADNNYFQYIGRINWQNPQAPVFSYPMTLCKFDFEGTTLKLKLSDDNWGTSNYVGVYLDDNSEPIIIHLNAGSEIHTYDVADNLEDRIHSAVIVKRNDYLVGEFAFHGIVIDGNKNIRSSASPTNRKIEIYGDSIAGGATVEYPQTATQDPPDSSPELDNGYLSFGAMLARDYQAELSLIAQGGISLVDGYGYWNNGIGMEAVYDKVKPLYDAPSWNFRQYIPNLVIIALGQNDASSININSDMTDTEWKQHYKNFITNLRSHYPNAYVICMFPNMYHDRIWDDYLIRAVREYTSEQNDNKVYSLITEQVTPGHPREREQRLMANALKNLIDTTLVQEGFRW